MKFDIVRAWKDAEYRKSLSDEQQAMLPENPVGACELTDAELETAQGAFGGLGGMGGGSFTGFLVNSNAQTSLLGVVTGTCMNSLATFGSCNGNSFLSGL